jgi:phosphoenolpyruvate carboxylase
MINIRLVKEIAIGLLILFIGYVIIVSIPKTKSSVVVPQELLNQIDSLKAENAKLDSSAHAYDSIIERYKFQIDMLDSEIVYNQSKVDTVKKKASIKINKVKGYTPDEVDSFFKDRYKY